MRVIETDHLTLEPQTAAHLLGRLGFSLASPEQHVARGVEPDEVLMYRGAD